jgi:hypothetical protein
MLLSWVLVVEPVPLLVVELVFLLLEVMLMMALTMRVEEKNKGLVVWMVFKLYNLS